MKPKRINTIATEVTLASVQQFDTLGTSRGMQRYAQCLPRINDHSVWVLGLTLLKHRLLAWQRTWMSDPASALKRPNKDHTKHNDYVATADQWFQFSSKFIHCPYTWLCDKNALYNLKQWSAGCVLSVCFANLFGIIPANCPRCPPKWAATAGWLDENNVGTCSNMFTLGVLCDFACLCHLPRRHSKTRTHRATHRICKHSGSQILEQPHMHHLR